MRPLIPAALSSARAKLVLPAPRSPRKWMRPPRLPGPKAGWAPHSMGANCAASAIVAASSGNSSRMDSKGASFVFMIFVYRYEPSVSHNGMVSPDSKVPADMVTATRRPLPPILAART